MANSASDCGLNSNYTYAIQSSEPDMRGLLDDDFLVNEIGSTVASVHLRRGCTLTRLK